jgi:hypothetical protein
MGRPSRESRRAADRAKKNRRDLSGRSGAGGDGGYLRGETAATAAGAAHAKSVSGEKVHARAGTDALASAQVANPAEMIFWMVLMLRPRSVAAKAALTTPI